MPPMPIKKREKKGKTQCFLWCHLKMAHLNLLIMVSSPLSKTASHKHDTKMNDTRSADAQCFKPTFLTPFAGFWAVIYWPVATDMEPLLQSQDDFFNHWHTLHGLDPGWFIPSVPFSVSLVAGSVTTLQQRSSRKMTSTRKQKMIQGR